MIQWEVLNMIKKNVEASDLNPNQKSFAIMRLETLQDYLEAGNFLEELVIGGVNIFDLRKKKRNLIDKC